MLEDISNEFEEMSHPPCGGCGLKSEWDSGSHTYAVGHPPCGGCGLKFCLVFGHLPIPLSPSVWRVWIEIHSAAYKPPERESPSVWRVWIEISKG